jgi:hypothetical protein
MSVDKLVDSTQLDADLTSVANAIRTKGGTSASLAFPAGFVQAIGDIPSGGSELPTGYKELLGVKTNNGASYLITDYTPVQGDTFDASFEVDTFNFALLSAGTGTYQFIVLPYNSSQIGGNGAYVKYFAAGSAPAIAGGKMDSGVWYQILCSSSGLFSVNISGTEYTVQSNYGGAVNTALYIGARANLSQLFKGAIGKIVIANNGILKRKYIPALRESDEKCGFYETVSGQFFGSSTGTDFTSAGILLSDAEALAILSGGA